MRNRIFGLETEYGCLAPDRDGFISPDSISMKVKNHIFHPENKARCGILDIHYRGRDEPPGNGGFLFNAGRVYIDMGHIEFTTPECSGLCDMVAFDKAGERTFQTALRQLGLNGEATFFKNNIDHFTGATFGCHENYLVRRNVPFSTLVIPALLPFLATRQIFSGAGRVGSYDDSFFYYSRDDQNERERQDPICFQISQRADHIVTETYQWIQFSRAIINTRDEPLADHSKYRRLHLLVGDSNMSEYATALKVGTTSLVLNLIEKKIFPKDVLIKDTVWALKKISHDQGFSWLVERHRGGTISAIDIQRRYLELARRHLDDLDEDGEWILEEWETVLDDLDRDPMSLTDRVDWVAKKYLLETFMEAEGLSWDDPWLQSLDLEYHNIDIDRGLYYDLERRGAMRRVVTDKQIVQAEKNPPQDTRARARAAVVRALTENQVRYIIDWDSIYLENEKLLNLRDPFKTYERETTAFIADMPKTPFNLQFFRRDRP